VDATADLADHIHRVRRMTAEPYQPVRELPSRRITGVDALARLRLPDGTLAMPADFIPWPRTPA
jgi:sensor c-di-GMP phosphodiesterase-like protein